MIPNARRFELNAWIGWLCLAFCWIFTLGLALAPLAGPPGFVSGWGGNPLAVQRYRDELGIPISSLDRGGYGLLFLALLTLAWLGWVGAVWSAYRGKLEANRKIKLCVWISILILAGAVPASLSQDAYAYAAYARMLLLYGLDPYAHSQQIVAEFNDPTAPFLTWDVVSPYGPAWTLISVLIVAPLASAPVYLQVAAFKFVSGAAVIVTASQAARIAERFSPDSGNVTFIAIACCPLFLLEGPGNGHNDSVMLAFFVWGWRLWLEDRLRIASLAIGIAAAVKFVTLAVVPWLIFERLRSPHRAWRESFRLAALVAAPILLATAAWSIAGASGSPLGGLWEHLDRVTTRSVGSGGQSMAGPLLAFYFLTLWFVYRNLIPWTTLWVALTLVAAMKLGSALPWYLMWPATVAFMRWDVPGRILTALCAVTAWYITSRYVYG